MRESPTNHVISRPTENNISAAPQPLQPPFWIFPLVFHLMPLPRCSWLSSSISHWPLLTPDICLCSLAPKFLPSLAWLLCASNTKVLPVWLASGMPPWWLVDSATHLRCHEFYRLWMSELWQWVSHWRHLSRRRKKQNGISGHLAWQWCKEQKVAGCGGLETIGGAQLAKIFTISNSSCAFVLLNKESDFFRLKKSAHVQLIISFSCSH